VEHGCDELGFFLVIVVVFEYLDILSLNEVQLMLLNGQVYFFDVIGQGVVAKVLEYFLPLLRLLLILQNPPPATLPQKVTVGDLLFILNCVFIISHYLVRKLRLLVEDHFKEADNLTWATNDGVVQSLFERDKMVCQLLDVLLHTAAYFRIAWIGRFKRDFNLRYLKLLQEFTVVVTDMDLTSHREVNLSDALLVLSLQRTAVGQHQRLKFPQESDYELIMAVIAIVASPIQLSHVGKCFNFCRQDHHDFPFVLESRLVDIKYVLVDLHEVFEEVVYVQLSLQPARQFVKKRKVAFSRDSQVSVELPPVDEVPIKFVFKRLWHLDSLVKLFKSSKE